MLKQRWIKDKLVVDMNDIIGFVNSKLRDSDITYTVSKRKQVITIFESDEEDKKITSLIGYKLFIKYLVKKAGKK